MPCLYTDSQKENGWLLAGYLGNMLMKHEDPILVSNYVRNCCLNITHFLGHLCVYYHLSSSTTNCHTLTPSTPQIHNPWFLLTQEQWGCSLGRRQGGGGVTIEYILIFFKKTLSYGEIVVGFNAVTYSVRPDELESPFQLYHSSRQEHVTLFISSFQQAA